MYVFLQQLAFPSGSRSFFVGLNSWIFPGLDRCLGEDRLQSQREPLPWRTRAERRREIDGDSDRRRRLQVPVLFKRVYGTPDRREPRGRFTEMLDHG